MRGDLLTVFLCGDVMLGRGVDQILPHRGDPRLWELGAADARAYVALAEAVNGPIPSPVDFSWPWGDALDLLAEAEPDVRIVNLENAVTRCGEPAPGKGIHYRMNPANLPCLSAVHPDVCVLANNHVLDFGVQGLTDTLDALAGAELRAAGAGRDAGEASRPAVVPIDDDHRVLVYALGSPTAGVVPEWAASAGEPGVAYLPSLSLDRAAAVCARIETERHPADRVIVSIHWGSNVGYDVPASQVRFAHALIDGGVDVVHGHSSHHPRSIEVYRDRPILYGCGDLINDYEGIPDEPYRGYLRLLYFADLRADTGALVALRMAPVRCRLMRLRRAAPADARWLAGTIDRISRDSGTSVELSAEGMLVARWR